MARNKKDQFCIICGEKFYSPKAKTCSIICRTKLFSRNKILEYKKRPKELITLSDGSLAVKVPLTQNKFALIDEADFDRVNEHKWYMQTNLRRDRLYAVTGYPNRKNRKEGRSSIIFLHRFILNIEDNTIIVDHINNDSLDCRKNNLRIATLSQNAQNRKRFNSNTSGYKGVSLNKQKKYKHPWVSRLMLKDKSYYLGMYATAEEAAQAYDVKACELFGDFASLNFPDKKDEYLLRIANSTK